MEVKFKTADSMQHIDTIREWIINEAKFNGRTDDEFIFMFLHGCKYNVDKTKIKMTKYYENRIKYPQWWANRDPSDEQIQKIAKYNILTILKPKEPEDHVIAISYCSRLGNDAALFHPIMKYMSLMTDIFIQQQCFYETGIIAIIDCKEIPSWFKLKMISPLLIKDFADSFYTAIPIRFHAIHFINSSMVIMAFWNIFRLFLPQKMRKRVRFYGFNWKMSLHEQVQPDRLPEELGGSAGPLQSYSEQTVNELFNLRDYFVEDEKYGFQNEG